MKKVLYLKFKELGGWVRITFAVFDLLIFGTAGCGATSLDISCRRSGTTASFVSYLIFPSISRIIRLL